MTYSKEELTLMKHIGKTLDKLDDATAKHLAAHNFREADAAQRKGMHEVERYLRQVDRLEGLFDDDDVFIAESLAESEAEEPDALKSIYAEMRKLSNTLAMIDASDNRRALVAQKLVEQEIKRILNVAGTYNAFNADEDLLLL